MGLVDRTSGWFPPPEVRVTGYGARVTLRRILWTSGCHARAKVIRLQSEPSVQSFSSGAQDSNRRFSPASRNRTSASVLSPLPLMSRITPSPNTLWRTSSPILSPIDSAPLRLGRRDDAIARSTIRSRPAATRSARSLPPPAPAPSPRPREPSPDRQPPLPNTRPPPRLARRWPSTSRTSPAGISSRNRLGGLYWVPPNSVRLQAWVRYSRRRARVMPT